MVVSDTSPVSNAAIIGRLDLLWRLFGAVVIPPAVLTELGRLSDAAARTAIEAAISQGKLRVHPAPQHATEELKRRPLHAGEAEAIALAIEKQADFLLMDERRGRAAALERGVTVMGLLGVLALARRRGWIASAKDEIARLREEAGFFVSQEAEGRILELAGEA